MGRLTITLITSSHTEWGRIIEIIWLWHGSQPNACNSWGQTVSKQTKRT